jgi:2-dehydropantoate 2-reductase
VTTPPARIAVVGPGAIGTTVAAALHEVGRTPAVYGRSARPWTRLDVPDEPPIVIGAPVVTDVAEATPVDLVLLAVKTTQTAAATPWLEALCGPGTVVCALQNGVEQVGSIAPLLGDGVTVVPSVVWFPAEAQADGSVRLRGAARLTVPDDEAGRLVAAAFDGSRCDVECVPDFRSAAWRKLLQNAMAGLMVLTGRRSGMYRRDDIAELSRAYVRECLAVARAEGAVIGDDVPDEIVTRFAAHPQDLGTSILADRVAGRPLEWDVRNGVIGRLGRAHGIPTPISDVVVPLLAAGSDGPG